MDNDELKKAESENEEKIAGECPKCEGDLIAIPNSNLARCRNCAYEEPIYASQG